MSTSTTDEVAMSAWVARVAHDLRAPLNAILGMSELLLEPYFGPLNDRQREYVRDIQASGGQLLGALDDMAEVARVRCGRSPLDLGPVDLLALLAGLGVAVEGPEPPPLVADARKLRRALAGAFAEGPRRLTVAAEEPGLAFTLEPLTSDEVRLSLVRCLVEQHGGTFEPPVLRLPRTVKEER